MAHMVIVGGGLAAESAARTLRTEGFDGDVTVLTDEPHSPYQRPPLSKGYLQGKEGADAVILHPDQWWDEQRIQVRRSTSVASLEAAAHRVALADGSSLAYDKLLLATGSSPRTLPIQGHDLPGVHVLRRLGDSDALHSELKDGGKRLVVIGGGWIGMEVAATARGLGNEVVVLARDEVPLSNAVGARMGEVFAQLHRENGVDLRTSVEVERIVGSGRAEGVVANGDTFAADLVLVGVGAAPNTALADAGGLAVNDGILTGSALRTSLPDVFAAGDAANAFHPVLQRHLRSEHWDNARKAGPVAAKGMLGIRASHSSIPYFYTDQFDLTMELSGYGPLMAGAEVIVRGDIGSREFIAFWVDHGRVVAGMNVNISKVNRQIQRLIASGERVDAATLADPDAPLDGRG